MRVKSPPKIILCDDGHPGCGESSAQHDHPVDPFFVEKVRTLLDSQKAIASDLEQTQFARYIVWSAARKEEIRQQRETSTHSQWDIIESIRNARDADQPDEAVWRSFLGAHFGRTSCLETDLPRIESAGRLLYGFGQTDPWTWEQVHGDFPTFREWLSRHSDRLRELKFGNHRKYESNKPTEIAKTLRSFVELAQRFGGPSSLIERDALDQTPGNRFDLLYRRLAPLVRFGRTARFDYLILMRDLNLVEAEPPHCYLEGATGPLQGARSLWGNKAVKHLGLLAVELASSLNIPTDVIEDSLCNWQKHI